MSPAVATSLSFLLVSLFERTRSTVFFLLPIKITEPSRISSTELFGLLILKTYLTILAFSGCLDDAEAFDFELDPFRRTVILRDLPVSPLPPLPLTLILLPGFLFPSVTIELRFYSESSRAFSVSAAVDVFRFYIPALTIFLKLTVMGFDLRVLIERRGFDDSC